MSQPKTVLALHKSDCSLRRVFRADRLQELMGKFDLSQSELGRRVGLSQQNIGFLLSGRANGSKKLHLLARELQTTPAYLTGEIDDPEEGAPPPPPKPAHQLVTMAVALPSEPVLAQLFEAVLTASPRLKGAELAHELARRLPTILAVGRLPLGPLAQDLGDAGSEASPDRRDAHPGRRRA